MFAHKADLEFTLKLSNHSSSNLYCINAIHTNLTRLKHAVILMPKKNTRVDSIKKYLYKLLDTSLLLI